MRANLSDRLAAETVEQREARLQRMHANLSDRLAAETEEQIEVRLQRMRARLASETEEQRPGCRGCVPIKVRGWLLRLNSRERPDCNERQQQPQLLFYPVFIITICVFPCFST